MKNVTLTKGVISRSEAEKLSPAYVAFVERHVFDDSITNPFYWDYDHLDGHGYATCALKKGQKMLTALNGQYVLVKVSAVNRPQHDADGPVVRVSNGEFSWRIDGDNYGVRV